MSVSRAAISLGLILLTLLAPAAKATECYGYFMGRLGDIKSGSPSAKLWLSGTIDGAAGGEVYVQFYSSIAKVEVPEQRCPEAEWGSDKSKAAFLLFQKFYIANRSRATAIQWGDNEKIRKAGGGPLSKYFLKPAEPFSSQILENAGLSDPHLFLFSTAAEAETSRAQFLYGSWTGMIYPDGFVVELAGNWSGAEQVPEKPKSEDRTPVASAVASADPSGSGIHLTRRSDEPSDERKRAIQEEMRRDEELAKQEKDKQRQRVAKDEADHKLAELNRDIKAREACKARGPKAPEYCDCARFYPPPPPPPPGVSRGCTK
ncbi:MAG: hypothetical protein ACXU8N_17415 [Telluria sp.]